MYNIYYTPKVAKIQPDKNRKFNMMVLYFLSNLPAGTVVYRGRHKLLIQPLFPHMTFCINRPLGDLTGNIYYIGQDEELRSFLKPAKILAKIETGQQMNYEYDILYPPRMSAKSTKLYCISRVGAGHPVYGHLDILKYQQIRDLKHTIGYPGLKKYCKCHDCWIEIEFIKKYLLGPQHIARSHSKFHNLLCILAWIRKNLPLKKKFCI